MEITTSTSARVPGVRATLVRGLGTGALCGMLAAGLHGLVLAVMLLGRHAGTASVPEAVGGVLMLGAIAGVFSGVIALWVGAVCGVAIAALSLLSTAVEARLPVVAVVVTAALYGLPQASGELPWNLVASSWACGTVAMVVHAVLLRRWILRRRLAGVAS